MSASEERRKAATERFQLISAAYDTLKDANKRDAYDRRQPAASAAPFPMPLAKAMSVFMQVVLESIAQQYQFSASTAPAIYNQIASLGLPATGFVFGGASRGLATCAISMLLMNPDGFSATLAAMSEEERREFSLAVLVLARKV